MIECRAKKDKSIFVSSRGYITPCCFIYGYGESSAVHIDNLIKRYNNLEPAKNTAEQIQQKLDKSNIEKLCNICFTVCDDSMKDSPKSFDSWEGQFRSNRED